MFRPSTIQDNPGPGSYTPATAAPVGSTSTGFMAHGGQLSPSNNNQDDKLVHRFAHLVKPSAPTIPKKEQSYGYVPQLDGALARQPQPDAIYSGVGHDTVGPAAYSAHHQIWDAKKNAAASLKSTVKRDVWEENLPRAALPVSALVGYGGGSGGDGSR